MRKLSPTGWALRPLKNYTKFSGRASRAEFWWFVLFMMIIYSVFWIGMMTIVGVSARSQQPSFAMLGALGVAGIFILLFYLALLIPSIALQVRRLHDTDRSGWWLGAFYLLYVLYFVIVFGWAATDAMPSDGSPPAMGRLAASGIIALLFFVYSIVLLVFFCLPGTSGTNRYGDDPYGPNVEEVFA